jgi:hypothetical protein
VQGEGASNRRSASTIGILDRGPAQRAGSNIRWLGWNETVQSYCKEAGVEFTRCRPYRKNDQAWVEQKNGAVVRRIVGYRRYVGLEAAAALGLYMSVRLFVNFFQPSHEHAIAIGPDRKRQTRLFSFLGY